MHTEAGHIVETPVEARAGFLDRPTLVVLMVSTSLMIGVFAVLYIGLRGEPPQFSGLVIIHSEPMTLRSLSNARPAYFLPYF
jgi:Flp pilus assembly protein protease CpaA